MIPVLTEKLSLFSLASHPIAQANSNGSNSVTFKSSSQEYFWVFNARQTIPAFSPILFYSIFIHLFFIE